MSDLAISIVRYNHSYDELSPLIEKIDECDLDLYLYIIDNSEIPYSQEIVDKLGDRVRYIFTGRNLGFGAGHNIALRKTIEDCKYHLVLNPDVFFENGTLEHIFAYMETSPEIGHLMPKILYPDGSLQYVCKLIPTPLDLIFKRFIPNIFLRKRLNVFQLRFTGYDRIMDVPYLSGCFMFLRTSALKDIGLFDERFFMYPEDIDLTRRIHCKYRTIFYPEASVVHGHAQGSYKNRKLLYIHVINMIKYFNKWGWIFDRQRKAINNEILSKLNF